MINLTALLTPSFTVLQDPTIPSTIVVSDTSGGSDLNITARRVYVQSAYGIFLVPSGITTNYIPWTLVDMAIYLDVLTTDTAANIKVEWIDSGGTALYTANSNFCFPQYNKQFYYQLFTGLVPGITLSTNYSQSLANVWTAISGAINAIEEGNDLLASQNCLNIASYYRTNQALFF